MGDYTLASRRLMSSLVALVSMFVESSQESEVIEALARLKSVKDVFEVTGEFDLVALVEAPDMEKFRDTLRNRIMKMKGVKSTVTSIILNPHFPTIGLDQAEPTQGWTAGFG